MIKKMHECSVPIHLAIIDFAPQADKCSAFEGTLRIFLNFYEGRVGGIDEITSVPGEHHAYIYTGFFVGAD